MWGIGKLWELWEEWEAWEEWEEWEEWERWEEREDYLMRKRKPVSRVATRMAVGIRMGPRARV